LQAGSFASRFAAFALLAFVILASWLVIVAPILTAHRELGSTIEFSRGVLNRYRALSAHHAQLVDRLEALEGTATEVGAYLTEPTDTLAVAALQEHVQRIVGRAGGKLRSSQVLTVEPAPLEIAAKRVGLKIQLMLEMGGLQDLFYDLETAQPFVFVSEVTISNVREFQHRNDAKTEPMLEVGLQVYAFRHGQS
jgi:general secretion pathway protein M